MYVHQVWNIVTFIPQKLLNISDVGEIWPYALLIQTVIVWLENAASTSTFSRGLQQALPLVWRKKSWQLYVIKREL